MVSRLSSYFFGCHGKHSHLWYRAAVGPSVWVCSDYRAARDTTNSSPPPPPLWHHPILSHLIPSHPIPPARFFLQEHDFIRADDAAAAGDRGRPSTTPVLTTAGDGDGDGGGVGGEEGDVSKQLSALHKSLDDQVRPGGLCRTGRGTDVL